MIKSFAPKGTVMQVILHNRNAHAYKMSSGLAYITQSGEIWLDGHIYPVRASTYLYNETYYPEPPQELMQNIERYIAAHVAHLVSESEKIDRSAIIPESTDDFMNSIFGSEIRYKDTTVRYRNLSGQNHNQRNYGQKIDAITLKHDPQALHNAIFNETLENYRFEIGGYLHLANEQPLTPIQREAVENYSLNGGHLGKTALVALGLRGDVD